MFRRILASWLGSIARDEIPRRAAGAADDAPTDDTPEAGRDDSPGREAHGSTEREPCDVGFVFALGMEAGGLDDLISGATVLKGDGFVARRGSLAGRRVVSIVSGPGRQRAAKATEALIAGHRPRWIVSAGLAGGLVAELRHADVVYADRVCLVDGTAVDLPVDERLALWLGERKIARGAVLTVDRVVRRAEDKRQLGLRTTALVVDMETAAVVEVCRRRGVPARAFRAVVDTVDDELPPDVERLLEQPSTAAKLGAALGTVWRRPGSARDLWNLQQRALVASDALARALQRWTRDWAGSAERIPAN